MAIPLRQPATDTDPICACGQPVGQAAKARGGRFWCRSCSHRRHAKASRINRARDILGQVDAILNALRAGIEGEAQVDESGFYGLRQRLKGITKQADTLVDDWTLFLVELSLERKATLKDLTGAQGKA